MDMDYGMFRYSCNNIGIGLGFKVYCFIILEVILQFFQRFYDDVKFCVKKFVFVLCIYICEFGEFVMEVIILFLE